MRSRSITDYDLHPQLIQNYHKSGLTNLFPWQCECLNSEGVLNGRNLIYSAPTSGGKTLVSEMLMWRWLSLNPRRKVLMVLPYVSIVDEKENSLRNQSQGTNWIVRGFHSNSRHSTEAPFHLGVCTIERANLFINKLIATNQLSAVSLVVVDELHTAGDPNRGYLLELMLTKLRYFAPKTIQIVGMSATLLNSKTVASWLDAAHYETNFRPVPLHEFIVSGKGVLALKPADLNEDDIPRNVLAWSRREIQAPEIILTPGIASKDKNGLISLVFEALFKEKRSVLIFCPSKRETESVAAQIADCIGLAYQSVSNSGGYNSKALDFSVSSNESINLLRSLCNGGQSALEVELQLLPDTSSSILRNSISKGVAFHHAGLSMEERRVVESGFKRGGIKILTATSTLAAGVNLPAGRVIFTAPYIGREFLDTTRYRQMAGRAGRTGHSPCPYGESIMIVPKQADFQKTVNLLCDPSKPLVSSLSVSDKSLPQLLLEVLTASNERVESQTLMRLTECTFFCTAADSGDQTQMENINNKSFLELDKNIKIPERFSKTTSQRQAFAAIYNSIRKLTDLGFLQYFPARDSYAPTSLGRSVSLSMLDPDEGFQLYCTLYDATKNGILLTNDLHVTSLLVAKKFKFQFSWEGLRKLVSRLDPDRKSVVDRLAYDLPIVDLVVLNDNKIPVSVPESVICAHSRIMAALVLDLIMQDFPIDLIASKFGVGRGEIQALQQNVLSASNSVLTMCAAMGWHPLWAVIENAQSRISWGCHPELEKLLEVPSRVMTSKLAKALYAAGLRTPTQVGKSRPGEVETVLRKVFLRGMGVRGSRAEEILDSMAKSLEGGGDVVSELLRTEGYGISLGVLSRIALQVKAECKMFVRHRIGDAKGLIREAVNKARLLSGDTGSQVTLFEGIDGKAEKIEGLDEVIDAEILEELRLTCSQKRQSKNCGPFDNEETNDEDFELFSDDDFNFLFGEEEDGEDEEFKELPTSQFEALTAEEEVLMFELQMEDGDVFNVHPIPTVPAVRLVQDKTELQSPLKRNLSVNFDLDSHKKAKMDLNTKFYTPIKENKQKMLKNSQNSNGDVNYPAPPPSTPRLRTLERRRSNFLPRARIPRETWKVLTSEFSKYFYADDYNRPIALASGQEGLKWPLSATSPPLPIQDTFLKEAKIGIFDVDKNGNETKLTLTFPNYSSLIIEHPQDLYKIFHSGPDFIVIAFSFMEIIPHIKQLFLQHPPPNGKNSAFLASHLLMHSSCTFIDISAVFSCLHPSSKFPTSSKRAGVISFCGADLKPPPHAPTFLQTLYISPVLKLAAIMTRLSSSAVNSDPLVADHALVMSHSALVNAVLLMDSSSGWQHATAGVSVQEKHSWGDAAAPQRVLDETAFVLASIAVLAHQHFSELDQPRTKWLSHTESPSVSIPLPTVTSLSEVAKILFEYLKCPVPANCPRDVASLRFEPPSKQSLPSATVSYRITESVLLDMLHSNSQQAISHPISKDKFAAEERNSSGITLLRKTAIEAAIQWARAHAIMQQLTDLLAACKSSQFGSSSHLPPPANPPLPNLAVSSLGSLPLLHTISTFEILQVKLLPPLTRIPQHNWRLVRRAIAILQPQLEDTTEMHASSSSSSPSSLSIPSSCPSTILPENAIAGRMMKEVLLVHETFGNERHTPSVLCAKNSTLLQVPLEAIHPGGLLLGAHMRTPSSLWLQLSALGHLSGGGGMGNDEDLSLLSTISCAKDSNEHETCRVSCSVRNAIGPPMSLLSFHRTMCCPRGTATEVLLVSVTLKSLRTRIISEACGDLQLKSTRSRRLMDLLDGKVNEPGAFKEEYGIVSRWIDSQQIVDFGRGNNFIKGIGGCWGEISLLRGKQEMFEQSHHLESEDARQLNLLKTFTMCSVSEVLHYVIISIVQLSASLHSKDVTLKLLGHFKENASSSLDGSNPNALISRQDPCVLLGLVCERSQTLSVMQHLDEQVKRAGEILGLNEVPRLIKFGKNWGDMLGI